MEDQHPNLQIPPEEGDDDQQPSQPPSPNAPPPYQSPSIPTTFYDTEELRRGTRIRNPRFLPDNTYGNRPPVEIERDLETQESLRPTNEDDDLGTFYSANFWRKIIASAAPVINIPQQYQDIFKLPYTEQELWRKAMNDEIKSLNERKVWDLVALPPG